MGLITILPIQNRRPRLGEGAAKRDSSFAYRVRIHNNVVNKSDVPVCAKAFCALHGITKNKLTYLQKGMKMTGQALRDMRGKHSTLHRKLNEHTKRLICDHIHDHIHVRTRVQLATSFWPNLKRYLRSQMIKKFKI